MASGLDDDEVVVGGVDDLAAAAYASFRSSGTRSVLLLVVITCLSTGTGPDITPLSDEEITLICRISPELSGDDHYDEKLAFKDQSTNHYHSDQRH